MKKLLTAAALMLATAFAAAAVNINTASETELTALPGIGPAKAKAIVEYRKLNGAFKSPEELKNVKGIGEGIFSKLKGEAVTSTPPAKKAGPALKK
ncbi:helix-hairpin-helix domain-containing protein [Neisseria sp. ZJ106]|uniref:Helix-hairpin-helix domain-containing protein n=1 Tax=Neisseria lisongii TaxID=2912188 RepID=A0ABY7RH20_9NEIS|nr:helix-hairpin-helix domain-containing protein [Neisseria lisongii]MCF7521713.1 helix-hairpin-helix domain-containing protein [Neisseria lisongii]MCF7522072.1 helix-hairpin-helix domain-containing protein [Neisseria lisongii]WCL70844.1 helix-hairpin-helix domain-containing protein [Neisseria lisongii]WCL71103.1 helix-hairpin-helix domain-containing protein [Neisseria lisongii]WCL71172.1 helix-hairpin-helix domain-containing protein [Neisseria lisongii]